MANSSLISRLERASFLRPILERGGLDRLNIPSNQIAADSCRPIPLGEKIAGGVLILVHIDLVADELPKLTGLLLRIEHCSRMLFPT